MYMYTAAHVGPCYITVADRHRLSVHIQYRNNLHAKIAQFSDSYSTMWVDLFPHSDSLSLCAVTGRVATGMALPTHMCMQLLDYPTEQQNQDTLHR